MKINWGSRNNIITMTGFAALLLAFLFLSYLPYWQTTRRLEQTIRSQQACMDDSARQSAQLQEVTQRIQLLRHEVRNYDRLVPDNKDLGTFLGQLSNELEAAGMKDIAVRALPPTSLGKCQQLPIEVRGTGSYEQFHDFLIRLENLPRMSSINRISIESESAMTGKVTVELTLTIYNTKTN